MSNQKTSWDMFPNLTPTLRAKLEHNEDFYAPLEKITNSLMKKFYAGMKFVYTDYHIDFEPANSMITIVIDTEDEDLGETIPLYVSIPLEEPQWAEEQDSLSAEDFWTFGILYSLKENLSHRPFADEPVNKISARSFKGAIKHAQMYSVVHKTSQEKLDPPMGALLALFRGNKESCTLEEGENLKEIFSQHVYEDATEGVFVIFCKPAEAISENIKSNHFVVYKKVENGFVPHEDASMVERAKVFFEMV